MDLSAALDPKGFGHVIAIIQPSPWTETTRPPELISWVQATHLGISVHLDSDTMHAYASRLDSSKPAGGVQLRAAARRGQGHERCHRARGVPARATQRRCTISSHAAMATWRS
ncbi:MAG: hypothetical protein IPQ07_44655 [Myxococcales bacterium]|nr:hypothetical protein [Myxococcales bacterium]